MSSSSRGRVVAGAVIALLIAFYVWTALTSADPGVHGGRRDPYNRQASAFLHGQLHLRVPPPPALLRLRDPYDPKQSLPVLPGDIRDLTLYHGKLYTYWGPVPAVLAFIPFRALGVGDLPPALALLIFALGALAFQALLLRFLAERFAPGAPGWARAGALVAVALGDVMPFMLRTPEVYEVAIGAGACFASAAMYLFATATLGPQGLRAGRLALGSLAAGLAFGSRPPMAVVIAFALLALLVAWRRGPAADRPPLARLALAALGPFALCVAAIGVYNAARFGSPAEFGLRYTLTGFDIHDNKLGHLSFLGPGLWYYLLQPLRPRVEFPFLWLGPPPFYPGPIPGGYEAPEKVAGLVWSVPFVLVLAAAPLALRRLRTAAAIVGLAVLLGLAMMAFAAAYQPVATQRYEVDPLTFLAPAAALVWLVALARPAGRRRRLLGAAAAVLAGWTVVVGVATSLIGYDDALRRHHAGTWATLRGAFAPVPAVAADLAGRPLIAAVDHDPVDPRPWHVFSLDLDGAAFAADRLGASVQVIAPRDMRATLRARVRGARRVLVAAGGRATVVTARSGSIAVPVELRDGRNDVRVTPSGTDSMSVSDLRVR